MYLLIFGDCVYNFDDCVELIGRFVGYFLIIVILDDFEKITAVV